MVSLFVFALFEWVPWSPTHSRHFIHISQNQNASNIKRQQIISLFQLCQSYEGFWSNKMPFNSMPSRSLEKWPSFCSLKIQNFWCWCWKTLEWREDCCFLLFWICLQLIFEESSHYWNVSYHTVIIKKKSCGT